jgi:hypothetical protein
MPNGADQSVYEYQGVDCWRTWFIEECEQSKLFGVTTIHRGRVELYRVGTHIFLEDAPWYSLGGQTHTVSGLPKELAGKLANMQME